uniref:Uncharacterized protein n=1 Tax=Brassica campestris TaxID=3711 RepID=M4E0N1_BRACM
MFMISWDIVETRRTSSAFKRFCSSSSSPEPSSSSPPPTKRPKVKIDAAIEFLKRQECHKLSSLQQAANNWPEHLQFNQPDYSFFTCHSRPMRENVQCFDDHRLCSGMNRRPIICYSISVTFVEQGFEEHIVKFVWCCNVEMQNFL